jgi:hypothetical protein
VKVFARAGSRKPRSDQHQECSTTENHGYRRLPMKMSPLCPMIDLRGRRKDQRNGETSAHPDDADP